VSGVGRLVVNDQACAASERPEALWSTAVPGRIDDLAFRLRRSRWRWRAVSKTSRCSCRSTPSRPAGQWVAVTSSIAPWPFALRRDRQPFGW